MTEKNGKFILTQEEHDEASNWLNSWFIRAEFLTKWWCTQHGWSHGRYQMLNMILYTKSVLGYSNDVIWLTVLKRLSLIWIMYRIYFTKSYIGRNYSYITVKSQMPRKQR